MACSYAELAVSFIAVSVTVTNIHFPYPWMDDQAELAWVAFF